jgi:hypothetical protein
MAQVFTGRDAVVRVYDQTTPTPLYVTASFLGNLEGPLGRDRPAEVVQINHGKGDAKIHHNIPTDSALFEPQQITFDGKLYDTDVTDDLLIALSNPFDDATWKPGGASTFTGVTTLGTVINADGTSVTLPIPKDAHRAAHLVNIEILWGADWGLRFKGVFFEASGIRIPKGDEADSTFSCTGTVYGVIEKITAFTTPATEIS